MDAGRGGTVGPQRRSGRDRAGASAIAGIVAISISVLIIVVVLAAMAFTRTPVREGRDTATPFGSEPEGGSEPEDEGSSAPPSDEPSASEGSEEPSAAPSPSGS